MEQALLVASSAVVSHAHAPQHNRNCTTFGLAAGVNNDVDQSRAGGPDLAFVVRGTPKAITN